MPNSLQDAIVKGVAWLAGVQLPNGAWSSDGAYPIGASGLALLKLETYALELGKSPFDPTYLYQSQVQRGLDYIFTNAKADVNGNIYFEEQDKIAYQTGIVLAAISATADPTHVVTTGSAAVLGQTYKQVADLMIKYLASTQNSTNGGWGYEPSDEPDNSVSGYVVLGLDIAKSSKYNFNCVLPASILTSLDKWITYIQNDNGGSGYTSKNTWINILKTGNLIQEMRLYGDAVPVPRVQNAINYIVNNWYQNNSDPGWRGTPTEYQATFTVVKGLAGYNLQTIGTPPIDWFADMSAAILAEQNADGSWPRTQWDQSSTGALSTTWALLTLEKEFVPVVVPPREQAITDLIESVALEQTALSHILNAEGEKIQKAVANTTSQEQLLAINNSVRTMVNSITRLEMVLQAKLELFNDCLCEK